MTLEEFKEKYEPVVKLGYDDLDGADIWREFEADLKELLDSERKHHGT